MSDWMTALVVAVIAATGTLAGVLLGYRKWRAERRFAYDQERRSVYSRLWDEVETANIDVRINELRPDELAARISSLNRFMLKAGPYLDDEDRNLARDYLRAITEFGQVVSNLDDTEAKEPFRQTEVIPPEVANRIRELAVTQERALTLRSELRGRVRTILRAP